MSMTAWARDELRIAGWGDKEAKQMMGVLRAFYDAFDSGGAVYFSAPVLMRLIAGKPLTPITDEPDQWVEHDHGVFQHKRIPSVFKDPRFHDGKLAYDLDAPDPRVAISFPYMPNEAKVASPVMIVSTDE